MVVAEAARWGVATDVDRRAAARRRPRAGWFTGPGDRDGDGYVEYERRSRHGLEHQGWKDSWDGIRFADGTMARAPIALAEVQGYAYAAWHGRAELADARDDTARAARMPAAGARDCDAGSTRTSGCPAPGVRHRASTR